MALRRRRHTADASLSKRFGPGFDGRQTMEDKNPRDDELWDVCRALPSDWEPHGKRKWPGRPESRPDCAGCRWFAELFRTRPDWEACANPESPRAGLLTFREQGCWQFEPEEERSQPAIRPAQCDYLRRFETFLRGQAAEFMREEIRRANDSSPGDGPYLPTPRQIRQTPLFIVVRRLLRHADEDFRRPAFDAMAARARKDSRRYWESARRYWARTVGEGVSGIRMPENVREVEDKFWGCLNATISEALGGPGSRPAKKKHKKAG